MTDEPSGYALNADPDELVCLICAHTAGECDCVIPKLVPRWQAKILADAAREA